ncbi:MAG: hypothetical protein M3O28_05185 [Actinomycetota bacterium]|nr:hypothetical protein [Actinomycetota bacterium]
MSPQQTPRVIDGRVSRKTSNSLKMSFQEGAGDPLALAVQCSEDGKGSKLGVLFGFKNGGPGKHGLTYEDGRKIVVQSREMKPTLITASAGAAVAQINRGDSSTAVTPDGRDVLHFAADPTEPMTIDIFRIVITDASGGDVGRLHVIRKNDGWKTVSDVLDSAWNTYLWWDRAGAPLPLLVLGTRLILLRELDELERDVLLSACVDLAIGLRPYIKQMN